MEVTLSGSSIFVKPERPNAKYSIEVTLSGISMDVKFVHPAKVLDSMVEILFERVTLVKLGHS